MTSAWKPLMGSQADQQAADNVWSMYAETKERIVPSIQLPPQGPWTQHLDNQPQLALPLGCDSSCCTYCQGMITRRRIGGENNVCWLRRKRSENELAALGNQITSPSTSAAAAVAGVSSINMNTNSSNNAIAERPSSSPSETIIAPDTNGSNTRVESMWDHALMEPQEALDAINLKITESASSSSSACTDLNFNSDFSTAESDPWAWDAGYLDRPAPIPSSLIHLADFSPYKAIDRQTPLQARTSITTAVGVSPHAAASDIVCGIEFEEHGWLLATAGVSKQVRVYSLASFLNSEHSNINSGNGGRGGLSPPAAAGAGAPLQVHRLASKLSSLGWNPDQPGVVTVGDYDGVVVQIDLESGHLVAEKDEHLGRRVWSVSHSHLRPHLAASGSEDGTVALWAGPGLQQIAARLRPSGRAAITGVQLSPFDENGVAVACADNKAYLYDLRKLNAPVVVLQGHSRPVSYVKYLNRNTVVTAATDATLAAWDLSTISTSYTFLDGTSVLNTPTRVFRGHCNSKNFVGLAVRPEDHLVACGSENAEVVAYSMAWEQPMVSYKFKNNNTTTNVLNNSGVNNSTNAFANTSTGSCGTFCSAVAWQPEGAAPGCGPLLAAATSDGGVKILGLRQHKEEEI